MIFSNLTISTNKRYIILFKINQTKVRHDIKSKQLASNLIGQCPCDSTDNKCISSNYLQDIFIFVKTYVKYNSRNTKYWQLLVSTSHRNTYLFISSQNQNCVYLHSSMLVGWAPWSSIQNYLQTSMYYLKFSQNLYARTSANSKRLKTL